MMNNVFLVKINTLDETSILFKQFLLLSKNFKPLIALDKTYQEQTQLLQSYPDDYFLYYNEDNTPKRIDFSKHSYEALKTNTVIVNDARTYYPYIPEANKQIIKNNSENIIKKASILTSICGNAGEAGNYELSLYSKKNYHLLFLKTDEKTPEKFGVQEFFNVANYKAIEQTLSLNPQAFVLYAEAVNYPKINTSNDFETERFLFLMHQGLENTK